jgi:hypothetical protein
MKVKIVIGYLLFACCFSSNRLVAQSFSLNIGFGLGSTLAKGEDANKKSRAKIQLSTYYNLNKQQAIGLEISSAGSLINSDGGSINAYDYDPATNTEKLPASNMNSVTVLAKFKYYWYDSKRGVNPFVEFGTGFNTYYTKIFDVTVLPSQKVKKTNFAFQPETGFSIGHFQASLAYLFGGSTPAFTGINDRGVNVKLESIRIFPLYLNLSWRFDF